MRLTRKAYAGKYDVTQPGDTCTQPHIIQSVLIRHKWWCGDHGWL